MQLFSLDYIFLGLSALAGVGLIVVAGQILWSLGKIRGEYARKFIHMGMSLWIASWCFFLPKIWVVGLAIVMAVASLFLKKLKWFRAIHSVRRITYGELSYALAIALTASIFDQPEVYALAIINLGFADGLAAVIGTRYGKVKRKVLGATKTMAGFYAAFLFAVFSGAIFWQQVESTIELSNLLIISHVLLAAGLVATVELIGKKGLDNIFIPLVTGLAFGLVV